MQSSRSNNLRRMLMLAALGSAMTGPAVPVQISRPSGNRHAYREDFEPYLSPVAFSSGPGPFMRPRSQAKRRKLARRHGIHTSKRGTCLRAGGRR